MWNKFSFRIKITVVFTVALMVLTAALTALSLMNARQNITTPMTSNLESFGNDGSYSSHFVVNENEEQFLTEEQLEELAYFHQRVEGSGMIQIGHLQEQLDVAGQNFTQYSLMLAGVVIVLGSLSAHWIAGIIVQPIKKLSTSVREIEADKLNMNLPLPKSHDEISQLTISFNRMLNKLHRSFESKQLFAQNASHELKTPLALIRADMEVLEMNDDPTINDYKEIFVEVKNSTERMIDLVEAMLAMGKNLTETDMAIFDAQDVFEDIFRDLKSDILSRCLEVEIIGKLKLKGEKILLRQAFSNLIHNAVRYSKDEGRIVVVLSENQIIIEDTGVGIPPESIDQLFDPFYRVDNSRSKKLGGNGLGLAITKNILDHHQMGIGIHSQVGIGTTITIKI